MDEDEERGESNLIRLHEIDEERRQELVRAALDKFNFFIHVTGWLSGCAFLVILGILIEGAMPFVFIPIGLWTVGLAYHAYRAFINPKPRKPESPEE